MASASETGRTAARGGGPMPAPTAGAVRGPNRARRQARLLKAAAWVGGLTPLAWIGWRTATGRLGVNPIETVTHWSGTTALVLLMVTLAVTPVRRITGWNAVIKVRRLLGLFAFSYVSLHLLIYVCLDLFFDFGAVVEDVMKRPYITVGFTAFLLLLPLAITSTAGWVRRLGKRWRRLHRLVYAAAALAVLHFLWLVKADTREPLIFAGVLATLMVLRLPLPHALRRRGRAGGMPMQRSAPRPNLVSPESRIP